MKTYDPNKFDVVFAGIRLNEGVADGTFVVASSMGPGFTSKSGVDGESVRSRQHDRRYTVRLTLMQTSAINSRLSAIYRADRNAENGRGVGAFLIQDRGGETLLQSPKAYIADDPDLGLEGEASTREWLFELHDTDVTHGGNPDD